MSPHAYYLLLETESPRTAPGTRDPGAQRECNVSKIRLNPSPKQGVTRGAAAEEKGDQGMQDPPQHA